MQRLVALLLCAVAGCGDAKVDLSRDGGLTPDGGNPHARGSCTDGVDCYCDRIQDSTDPLYDANIIFCEDFEEPALNDGKHGWADKYPGQVDGCWATDGAGELVVEGTCPTCCANVVQEGACEVAGEDDCVFDGASTFGHRLRPGETGGIVGQAHFTEKTKTFGVTYALKYSHNFSDPLPAMKTNEFGNGWHCILGCSTWSFIGANVPFTATFLGSVPGLPTDRAFDTLVGSASAPEGIAYSMAPPLSKYEWRGAIRPGDDADKQVFAPGQWGCFQMHVRDWGTSSATLRYFFNDKLIHHSEAVDMTHLQVTANGPDDDGIESFIWNHYFNDGFTGDTVSYRLEDNFVVTKGDEPVSCTAIGLSD